MSVRFQGVAKMLHELQAQKPSLYLSAQIAITLNINLN